MQNHSKILGSLIERQRFNHKRLTRKDLSSLLGFKNLGKGISKIERIESGEMEEPLVSRICELLDISELDRKRCEKEEERLFLEYRKSLPPFRPHIVIRYGPCIYVRTDIPSDVDPVNYLAYTVALSKEKNLRMCLQVDYELRYWVNPDETHIKGNSFGTGPSTNPSLGKVIKGLC